jgi:glycosyltransferase involved in cell wall biosynthesis
MNRILHISTHDSGGAGVAAYRLHSNFQRAGFESAMAVLFKTKENVIQVTPRIFTRVYQKLKSFVISRRVIKTNVDYYFFNDLEENEYFSTNDLLSRIPFKPDIIILYWISNFLNSRNVYELEQKTGAKVFWYFMDLGPFTGGCHYSWDCNAYLSACNNQCPAIDSPGDKTVAAINFEFKRKFLAQSHFIGLLPSKEYVRQFSDSKLFNGKKGYHLPIALDINVFRPSENKALLRERKNIPPGRKIILLASGSLNERRKGSALAIDALKRLYSEMTSSEIAEVLVVLAGKDSDALQQQISFDCVSLGQVTTDGGLVEMYQLADVFLCPTIQDAGPMMVNESLLCGLPVVGFKVGILPDVIENGKTGYLVERFDTPGIANALREFLRQSPEKMAMMSVNSRNFSEQFFSPDIQLKNLIGFIESDDV